MNSMIRLGTVIGAKGAAGTISITTNLGDINLPPNDFKIFIGFSENFANEFTVTNWQLSSGKIINLELRELDNSESAAKLKDMAVFIDEIHCFFNDDGKHFVDDIIGCKAFDSSGNELGIIIDVWILPANDVWVININGKEVPIPVVDEYILLEDIENKRVEVKIPEGMLNLDETKDE